MILKINKEFHDLIPPLSDQEYEQLEKNIISDGCRDPITIWQDTIIDGHNRYKICTDNDIIFNTVEMEFNSHDAAKLWMIENQNGRRNLTDGWRFELSQTKKAILIEIGKEKKVSAGKKYGENHSKEVLPTMGRTSEPHSTRDEIANDLGWSKSKVARADKVWREADDETLDSIKSGDTTINQAYNDINGKSSSGKFHVSSGNNDWYTPEKYIDSARLVLGSIDTDPASSDVAQKTVKAVVFYTKETNGLDKDWKGNVWMNPPYSMPEIKEFTDKLLASQNVNDWIVLTNNSSDTSWFHDLLNSANYICFTRGRVGFENADNDVMATRQGQCFFYKGSKSDAFISHFKKYGAILEVIHEHTA